MRLSWLEPEIVRDTRAALLAVGPDWETHFYPEFRAPPAPAGFAAEEWPRVAEHVARAERVSAVVRAHGMEASLQQFGESPHAIELATLTAAAQVADCVTFELVEAVLTREIDELVLYGTFLTMLVDTGEGGDRVLDVYERFCAAARSADAHLPSWPQRVASALDGLASLYARYHKSDEAHALFEQRHAEDRGDAAVALTASRSFLAAGDLGRAIDWLGRGADRARALGRRDLESALRRKQTTLRGRLS